MSRRSPAILSRLGATRVSGLATAIALVFALAFLGGPRSAGSAPEAWHGPPEIRRDFPPEDMCDRTELPVLLELDRASIDSIGRAFSHHNERLMARATTLLENGHFGDPKSKNAIKTAREYFQIRSWSAMYTISNLTDLRGGVARMEGSGHFLPLIESYYHAAMYPLRHVDVAQVGEGTFCLRYKIPPQYDETFTLGEQKIRVHALDTKNHDGKKVRVLDREWATGDGGLLELLYESGYTGRVHRERIMDRGDLLDLVTFYDIEGLYVRKHGTHRLSAMAIWRNVVEGDEIPEHTRIGSTAYFPEIDIDLPWFLPDLGLSDLRDFAYPLPLLSEELFENGKIPAWLGADAMGRFDGWDTCGPRPEILDQRFPDL